MIKTTLDELIKALRWMQDDERNFDLSHPVTVTPDEGITVVSRSFIYKKIKWFLKEV